MKKFYTLLVFLAVTFCLNAQTMTVHIYGSVLRDSTFLPVVNHELTIQADSNNAGFTFYTTRFTNQTGHYDCTITNVPISGTAIMFTVKTKNCDSSWIQQTFVGTTTTDTVNFLICNGNVDCLAAFTYSLDSTASNHEVHFIDGSSSAGGYITAWHWDFGDGTTHDVLFPDNPNVSHVYTGGDLTHTVCLSIESNANGGCSSTVCHQVTIGNNNGCQAYYTHYADSTNLLHVHFTDASTPQNVITSRLWNFGDPLAGVNNTSTNFDPWHTYTVAGVYTVCLTIATSTGCSSTYCDSIVVGTNTNNCENWFTYTSTGLTYTFEGHTHSIYPTTYNWEMGDGSAGLTGHVVTHTYAASGAYTVTLTSVDSMGCAWTRTEIVQVQTTTYDLYGYVFLYDSVYADHGLAELMRVDSGYVTVIDSVEFSDSLGMYHFGGVLPGHYYIMASLTESSSYYGHYVPTYYHDAVNWANATLIELGQPANPYNIHMHHTSNCPTGGGNINGTITQGGKYNGNGIPAANVEVLLEDASSVVLAYTMTDANGAFTFTNIGFSTYEVYPEMVEKTTSPTTIVLDATHTGGNVNFVIQGSNISGINNVAAQSELTVSDVYPNPVTDAANMTIHALHSTEIIIAIYSITGEFISEITSELHTGANKIVLPVSELGKGLYYVKVTRSEGGIIVKKFISGR